VALKILLSVNAQKHGHHQCGRDVTIITLCSSFFHSQHVWMQQSYFTSLHDSLILLTTDTYKMTKEFVFKDRSSSAVPPNCCKTINFIHVTVFTNPSYTIRMIYKTQRTHMSPRRKLAREAHVTNPWDIQFSQVKYLPTRFLDKADTFYTFFEW
jgi:hypothetical protein